MRFLIIVLTCVCPVFADKKPHSPGSKSSDWVYIENGTLRLGVLKNSGGGIGHISNKHGINLLNHFDRGRLIQQSYYGDEDGSFWVKRPWRYNPVQGGNYKNKIPPLLEIRSSDQFIYTKSTPLHWATGQLLKECTMEQWIHLEDNVIKVKFAFQYRGERKHKPRHQELPAVFLDASLSKLLAYSGDKPWQNEKLATYLPGEKNEYYKMSENWACYINEEGVGFGVYVPMSTQFTCYRFRGGSGSDCSYVAPIKTFALTPGLKFEYIAYFTTGTADEIRQTFAKIRKK